MVFLSHWHLWSDFPPSGMIETFVREFEAQVYRLTTVITWPTGGQHPAVIGFFVLSGFCIHYPFEYRSRFGMTVENWRGYFRRRFLRIFPVYWAASLLGLVLVMAESFRPSGDPIVAWHAAATPWDGLIRFLGIAGIYPHEIFAGNAPLMTVSIEVVMYVIYPVFYWFSSRGRWVLLGTLFVALQLGGVAILDYVNPFWVFNSIIMLGVFWYAGALAAHLFVTGRGRVSGLGLLLSWGVFLGLKALPHFAGLNLLKQAAWGLVCMIGILWALRLEREYPHAGRWRSTVLLRGLGNLSYSLYAMHTPALLLATWALVQFGVFSYSVQLAAAMAAAIVATTVVHYGVERVFYRPRVVPASGGGQQSRRVAAHSLSM